MSFGRAIASVIGAGPVLTIPNLHYSLTRSSYNARPFHLPPLLRWRRSPPLTVRVRVLLPPSFSHWYRVRQLISAMNNNLAFLVRTVAKKFHSPSSLRIYCSSPQSLLLLPAINSSLEVCHGLWMRSPSKTLFVHLVKSLNVICVCLFLGLCSFHFLLWVYILDDGRTGLVM
ncbi:uncharacterized protein LOC129317362 [Prosopis cineraria]|uniref:uncharacterized protein LOC129317362 n=1 Tax=Prosopis cineraria TaxID=364024 RepID=UPI00240FC139|nr:uncharacterized protein LOC129317362 [Prosopis cineraria]